MKAACRYLCVVMFLLVAVPLPAAEVKNVQVYQQGNKAVFTYDLVGGKSQDTVKLNLTVAGKNYTQSRLHLSGDIGSVRPGSGKRIIWNVLQDFPRGVGGDLRWELTGSGIKKKVAAVSATGRTYTDPTTGLEFVLVKGGCYQMGDTFGEGEADEKPVHEVCVDDYYIGKTEVTVGQFRRFVDATSYRTEAETGDGCYVYNGSNWNKERDKNWRNPGFRQADSHPVACVSWNDAGAFIGWLDKNSSQQVRLPTEAEWEYAARSGGKNEKWAGTSNESSLGSYVWYSSNSGKRTHPVGEKQPNGLGLYDMSGNVWEWCQDWYGDKYYGQSSRNNPQGASTGSDRVIRGGGWGGNARLARAANRFRGGPGFRDFGLGFRLVLP